MLPPITIRYPVRPARRGLAGNHVADLFGLTADPPPHTVAANLELDIRPADLVLVSGPSGSGKSSLLREAGRHLGAVDVTALSLPAVPLIDALPGTVEERLTRLAGCGLGEARLALRTPAELSDGQRYRFRIAHAMSTASGGDTQLTVDGGQLTILLDEFAAVLDRPLAKVLAFNLRKLVTRTGVGAICATTHDDLLADLNPDVAVRCRGDGRVTVERRDVTTRPISFADDLIVEAGTRADWEPFAGWHYRSHRLGFVKRVVRLRHGEEVIGVCVFASPAASLTLRTHYFGLTDPRGRIGLAGLNAQLWLLQRVVLHPTYRGAGIAAAFIRRACEGCPVDWIETLTAMGHANPVFERAGFARVGVIRKTGAAGTRNGAYAGRAKVSAETAAKSRFSEPVYYMFDNRRRPALSGGPRGLGPPDKNRTVTAASPESSSASPTGPAPARRADPSPG